MGEGDQLGMTSPGITEKELIVRAAAGDAEAFGDLYSMHLDAIYRYIFFRIGEPQEAEDLTETVFLKAWEALPGYKDLGNPFTSWLYRIAHNMVIDFHRRNKPIIENSEANLPDEREDVSANTLGIIIESENLSELAKAVSQLSSEQQQVISLRFIQGLSHSEIARVIGKNEGTCRMIQHRALTTLSKILGNGVE
jgi:RNA polymerase sigma-70 factor, ECF subfamily